MTFHHEVNSQQKEAIRTVEGPVMVVAGPGSGKTRVLTFRIAHLIQIGVPAYQILALTFTNKAANEMRERIIALVGEKSRQLWMGTFHSVLARILRVECKMLGYDSNFSIYDTTDTLGVIKEVMHETGISAQQYNPQAIRARVSTAKNRFLLPDEFAKQAADLFEEKAARIYAEYQKRLKKNNALDFDDLLIRPIELFQHHTPILHKYQDRFRFILIDEYQDTNHAQYVLIKLLADKLRNICVVGDDAQSIYGFRGADIRNILDFQRDYPDAKIIRLEQNYRSTKTILAAADQVIKHNVNQLSKNLWTENDEGDKITLLTCQDDRDEGAAIVSRIYQESLNRKLDLKDFAVMYRTNAQSRALEDAFMQQSVRYVIVGGVRFYERKEIKDVMAYLRLLVNPQDDESFLRIVNVPGRGLGNVAIQRLRSFAGHHALPLVEASRRADEISTLLPKAKKGLRELSELLGKYSGMMEEMSASEVSRAFVDEIGILRLFKEEGTPESMARWENVQELLTAITEFSSRQPDATLATFLQDQALLSDTDQWDDKHNAVTLMTLHSAKGLEFPVVFIAGLEEGLLPFSNSSVPDAKELEEERRLYYVGLTRAMQKLYLSYARVRFRFSELSYQSPSRFIDEIDQELLEGTAYGKGAAEERWTFPPSPPRGRKKIRDADAQYHTDVIPDYDHEQEALKPGNIVMHEIFGKGKVLQVSGSGEALKAVVEFSTAGKKNLLLKYARLRLV